MLFKILLIALLVSPCLFAQGDFSEDVEITIQAGDFLTRLKQIEENPFDLNRVSVRQMFDIPFITRSLARNIVDKRKQHPFKHVAELKQVEGVTEDLFQAIQPYFRIHTASSRFSLRLEQRAAAIAHKARGYLNGVYGNRIALRQRFKISWDNQTNLLLQSEKDAGERNWLDHVSGSLQLQNGKKLMLLLGDYYAVFGHGLVAAGAYGKRLAASGGVTSLIPTVIRLRGKTGVDEVSFLRGAACVLSPSERLQMFIAVSSRQLDGVLTEDSTAIKRLDVSGLHRTETEVARLNLQKETLLQTGIALQFEKASVGVLWQRNKYQKPLQVVAGSYFGGNSFSATFKYHNKSMITSLETAIAPVGTAVLGTLVFPSHPLNYGISAFHYTNRYFAPHGKQLGSFSDSPMNRHGVELLTGLRLPGRMKLSLRAGASAPIKAAADFPLISRRTDILLQKSGKKIDVIFRYSARFSGESALIRSELHKRYRWRAEWRYRPEKALQVRQRVEYSRTIGKQFGISLMHEFRYSFNKRNRIQFRYTHFDIPDFQLRQYEVETGLPGELESRLLNGRGYKWFFLITVSPVKQLSFALKYRSEYYPDMENLGSGNDLVLGNARRYLRAYMRLEF